MKSLESQLRQYREAAILRAEREEARTFESKNARKRWLRKRSRTKDEMRSVAVEVLDRGPEGLVAFLEFLRPGQPPAIRQWAAFHVLGLSEVDSPTESLALGAIEQEATGDPRDKASKQIWLRNWRASRNSRDVLVMAICRLPIDIRMSNLSPVELHRAAGYPSRHTAISSTEIEHCLRDAPELVDAWLSYSADQRTGNGWYVTTSECGRFRWGRLETGESELFTDGVVAVAKYAALKIQKIGEYAN
ncbi:MAG: hypothetical protein AAGG02_10330 [Cyanobacteria bacterium P01_H01_bin.15]